MIPLLLAAAAAAAPGGPGPSDVKVFTDWAVACDNGKRCEAVAMIPDSAQSNVGLWLRREAGPAGAVTIHVRWPGGATGAEALIVDGKRFAMASTGDDVIATGAEALDIARALAGATGASAVAGTVAQPVSTHGSAAAMRYMDAAQGRAGTVTALVATGPAAAAAVPPAPPLPVIMAGPVTRRPALRPAAAMVAAMRGQSQCAADDDMSPSADSYPLDGQRSLVLLSCGAGAYNANFVPYLLTGKGFALARFDAATGESDDPAAGAALTNASIDGDGILSSFAKGRGIGDCGVSQRFAWDGARFRLIEQTELGECRGGIAWPTTWRARITRR
ncbi:MAG TPA: DUF1176 domain-containing protein [Sphingomonas sp.]